MECAYLTPVSRANTPIPQNGCSDLIFRDVPDYQVTCLTLQVSIDNCTTPVYTVVNIICIDRKGLVYDLMRLLKDIQIRGAYGKIVAHSTGRTEIDLFVQEIDGCRILDRHDSPLGPISSLLAYHERCTVSVSLVSFSVLL